MSADSFDIEDIGAPDDNLVATLRRRAKQLENLEPCHDSEHDDVLEPQWRSCITRAASELAFRRRCASDAEQQAISAIQDCRMLRGALQKLAEIIQGSSLLKRERDEAGAIFSSLARTTAIGKGRNIISVPVGGGADEVIPLEVVLDAVKREYLDRFPLEALEQHGETLAGITLADERGSNGEGQASDAAAGSAGAETGEEQPRGDSREHAEEPAC